MNWPLQGTFALYCYPPVVQTRIVKLFTNSSKHVPVECSSLQVTVEMKIIQFKYSCRIKKSINNIIIYIFINEL